LHVRGTVRGRVATDEEAGGGEDPGADQRDYQEQPHAPRVSEGGASLDAAHQSLRFLLHELKLGSELPSFGFER
jgi:hypothetical protein